MFNFFAGIADLISTVVGYVLTLIDTIIKIFAAVLNAITYLLLIIGYFPAFLTVFAAGFIGLAIVRFILNKGE